MKKLFSILMMLFFGGCMGMPKSVTPVNNFELTRYLGKWYEIARLDHSFERDMVQVFAEYSMREDGGVHVKNKGFSTKTNTWSEIDGKAYFVGKTDEGYLKVSFFGPFYGSYIIFELDKENYQYAFVTGPNTSYLWLLSRTPTIDDELRSRFIQKAGQLGFQTSDIIFVNQK